MTQIKKQIRILPIQDALGEGCWRLDYVSNITSPLPNQLNHTGPFIKVYFSRLIDNFKYDVFSQKSITKSVKKNHTASAVVGIGALPILKAGSVWQEGVIRGQKKLSNTVHIEIDTNNVRLALINPTNDEEFDIKYYPWRKNFLYFIKVRGTVDDERMNILFLTTEIARFYYGYTSPLADLIFSNKILNLDNLYNTDLSKSNFHADENKKIGLILQLRKEWSDKEGEMFLRLFPTNNRKNSLGYKGVTAIRNSCIQHKNTENTYKIKDAPINTNFPFAGNTSMQVKGKRIKDSNDNWYFLVLEIKECSGSFPFDWFIFNRDNDNRKGKTPLPDGERHESWEVRRPSKTEPTEAEINHDEDADESRKDIYCAVEDTTTSTFSDLLKKKYQRFSKDTNIFTRIPSIPEEDDKFGDEGTTGEARAGGKKRYTHIELTGDITPTNNPLSLQFNCIKEALDILRKRHNVIVCFYDAKKDNLSNAECYTYFPPSNKTIEIPWASINKHSRRFIMAEMKVEKNYFYLLEIEKPKIEDKYNLIIFHSEYATSLGHYLKDVIYKLSVTKMEEYSKTLGTTLELNYKLFKHTYSKKETAGTYSEQVAHKIWTCISNKN